MSRFPATDFTPSPAPLGLTDLGLSASGVAAGIKVSGKPDVALLVADRPISCAGVFTRNAFAAAPVLVSREHLAANGGLVRAIVVNAGNANACTGDRGLADARAMCRRTAELVGCAPEEVLVSSTGVIGVPLPISRVISGIDAAHASLSREREGSDRFLAAIQTTDAFPKAFGTTSEDGVFRVAGVCKGAGMIEPNMATMLAFVGTDLDLDAKALAEMAHPIARRSFNAIHVDSHASTNDTLLLLATGRSKVRPEARVAESALREACERLAWLIARDGEGATKVTTIEVTGAADDADAEKAARAIAHSALVRTALFGNDPNWGRFVSAVGNATSRFDPSALRCRLEGTVVFEHGRPTSFDRSALSAAMKKDDLRLELELGAGTGSARVMTSDLGYRYVEVNAEYTT